MGTWLSLHGGLLVSSRHTFEMSTWDSDGAILAICGSSSSESGFGRLTCFTFPICAHRGSLFSDCVWCVGLVFGVCVFGLFGLLPTISRSI